MGPPAWGTRGGSAQLRNSVGKLADAATAAPRPAVLKKLRRVSMAEFYSFPVRAFYQLLRVPPMPSSALMIWADHSATSASVSVRSHDWNCARNRIEYLP